VGDEQENIWRKYMQFCRKQAAYARVVSDWLGEGQRHSNSTHIVCDAH